MTVYLRTYGALKGQPESEETARLCNNVIKTVIAELRLQGIDAKIAEFGTEQLINHDANCNPIVPKPKYDFEYCIRNKDLYLSAERILPSRVKVPNKTHRNFDYMSIDSVLKSYEQNGITYVCNGDFTTLSKFVEY